MSFLRAKMPEDPAPGAVLTQTNALLGIRADTVLFATACYILLDPGSGRLRYASAGHLPALILDRGREDFRELPRTGMPLGILEDATYEGVEEDFPPGSLLVLYTDGIVEARDTEGRQFGMEATKRLILENRDKRPQDISRALLAAVETHCAGSPYVRDDIAIVVIRADD
jgi:sigma-B regulation protein RsbU (phosphoserine phosphatase)